MKYRNLAAVLLLILSTSAWTGEKRELILEMLEITQAQKNHELLINSYIRQFSNNPVMATESFEKFFREAMSWNSLLEPMIKIYEEAYTVEELKSLNQFFSSTIGQSFVAKTPEVNEKSTAVFMSNMQSALKHLEQTQ